MDKFSKKYQKWYRCLPEFQHPKSNNLYRFGKYYYNIKKDVLIHEDVVEDYINNITKLNKKFKKDAYCIKNNIEIKS